MFENIPKETLNLISMTIPQRKIDLFPNGTSIEELEKHQMTININMKDQNGKLFSKKITVHKKISPLIQPMIDDLIANGLRFDPNDYLCGGYKLRNIKGSKSLSHHSYGTAIDFNVRDNRGDRNPLIKPRQEFSAYWITEKYVPIFRAYGFNWGGYFRALGSDPMHISFLEIGDNDPQSPDYSKYHPEVKKNPKKVNNFRVYNNINEISSSTS